MRFARPTSTECPPRPLDASANIGTARQASRQIGAPDSDKAHVPCRGTTPIAHDGTPTQVQPMVRNAERITAVRRYR